MANCMKNFFKSVGEFIYKHLEENSGKMLLFTSMTGIALSCLAQTGAIIFNNKYKTSEKMFMVPQELSEGFLTIILTFIVARPIQKLTGQLVRTGKLINKELLDYLKKNNLVEKRGNVDFDIKGSINEIIKKIEKSDKFIKSNEEGKLSLLSEHTNMLKNYDAFSDASSAFATTGAAMITTAFITPTLRNYVASNFHRKNVQNINEPTMPTIYNYSKHTSNGSINKI